MAYPTLDPLSRNKDGIDGVKCEETVSAWKWLPAVWAMALAPMGSTGWAVGFLSFLRFTKTTCVFLDLQ
jgi:hypothetical protein